MNRQIQTINQTIRSLPVPTDLDPPDWLAERGKTHGLRWLLVHADDGVIWGEVRQDSLRLSGQVFPQVSPCLRKETLQEARLFGEKAELHLWRDSSGWQASLLQDGEGRHVEYYDEEQLLWGTEVEQFKDGFALLRQGAEGLRHAPPVPPGVIPKLPLRLTVRHYLDYDPDGQAYIAFSRLVSISAAERKQGGQDESATS